MASRKRKQGRSLSPRNLRTRSPRRRYLIFCEDTYGGTTYFRKMREELRFSNVSIRLGDQHGEPYGLVLDAKKRKESAHGRRREQGGEFDEVWCVIDIEAPRPHDSLDEAMRLAHRSGIELAYANPCFELWLFLHQRDHSGYLTTESAIAKMRGLECCYTSGKDFDPEHFLGRPQQEAIRRAELLDKQHEGKSHPRDRNPWTNIHILVRGLLKQGWVVSIR